MRIHALSAPPDGLFWSAPLAPDSDFTAEDPLALDYLGQQAGLWLFPGFTTRTSRAQYYAVVLYGLHLVDKAVEKYGFPGDDETRTRLFERWERFWALATLEFRKGQLERGDEDAMRGVLGATGAWFPGKRPLPLDFHLISRQSELGGLGAYLSSLREYGLASRDSLRVTPVAREIIDSFWTERGRGDRSQRYEEYSLRALNLESSDIVRSSSGITFKKLGERSRLSALGNCGRTEQQERLWNALFVSARDGSTLPLAKGLIAAQKDGVDEPEALLEGLLKGRWGNLGADNRNKAEVALAFGQLARVLLQRFNRAYEYIYKNGLVADFTAVAKASFPAAELRKLRAICKKVLSARDARRFGRLQYHGPDLLGLLKKTSSAEPGDALDHLLDFHRAVQQSRRGGGAWLRKEKGNLVLQVTGYNGYKSSFFPGMKLKVVLRLLEDLGKL